MFKKVSALIRQVAGKPLPAVPGVPVLSKRRRLAVAILLLFHLLGALSSLDALMSSRTSQGSIAWIISLNTFPYVSVPAYWVFGRPKFQGYVISRRETDSDLWLKHQLKMSTVDRFQLQNSRIRGNMQAVESLAKMPFVTGNDIEYLIDGQHKFDSIFAGIRAAEDYVLAQYYIIRDDEIGRQFQQALIDKAQQGVRVYLLYDEIGSYRLSRLYLRQLEQAGVHVRPFHSTKGPGNRFQLNFRNHRKLVITDGKHAWLGGANIGDEYLGESLRYGNWRDTHLKISGPAVMSVQLSFVEDWYWSSDVIPDLNWQPVASELSDWPILILPSGPADRHETASLMMQHMIHSAVDRFWISSPYFVPDESVLSALKLAALRGVDVRILIPERTDNYLVYLAAYAFVSPLIELGIDIYRYQDGVLHSKSFLVDQQISSVGTVNLDNRSFRLNFEITALIGGEKPNQQLEQIFQQDFERSRTMTVNEVENKPLFFRALSRAAYLMAPVL